METNKKFGSNSGSLINPYGLRYYGHHSRLHELFFKFELCEMRRLAINKQNIYKTCKIINRNNELYHASTVVSRYVRGMSDTSLHAHRNYYSV